MYTYCLTTRKVCQLNTYLCWGRMYVHLLNYSKNQKNQTLLSFLLFFIYQCIVLHWWSMKNWQRWCWVTWQYLHFLFCANAAIWYDKALCLCVCVPLPLFETVYQNNQKIKKNQRFDSFDSLNNWDRPHIFQIIK